MPLKQSHVATCACNPALLELVVCDCAGYPCMCEHQHSSLIQLSTLLSLHFKLEAYQVAYTSV